MGMEALLFEHRAMKTGGGYAVAEDGKEVRTSFFSEHARCSGQGSWSRTRACRCGTTTARNGMVDLLGVALTIDIGLLARARLGQSG